MKKIITLLSLLLMISAMTFAQNGKYLRVKIQLKSGDITRLSKAGISTDAGFYNSKENYYQAEIPERDYRKLQELGFETQVLVEDLSDWYAKRNEGIDIRQLKQEAMREASDYEVPYDFELGSCGGFSTIQQCYTHLDHMADLYPDLITVKQPISSISTTLGEPVYYVKISDNPNEAEDEPQVLYTGMHHAREPIGMQHLLFYMYYILEHYNTDPDIKQLIDNTEMYFVPIVNVDGYQHNITTSPNGGGMWRKNRRNNGDGTFGVDLNRNYGFAWGYDDEGSSPYPSDETYRGLSGFSEPETQIMKEFCESHNFKIALNYHSYSNLLLYPWGYISDACPDDNVLFEYSRRMTADNKYTYGPGSTTIYPSNGGSDDWMYGEQTTKNKILSYTPECGGSSDGFWPLASRIIPLCQENMLQSLLAARFSGSYAEIEDRTPLIIPEKQFNIDFALTRLGQTEGNFTVSVEPLGEVFVAVGEPVAFGSLALLETKIDSISVTLNDNIKNGDTIRYVLAIDNGYYITRDTIQKYYGTPVVVFFEDFPDVENWTGAWGLYSTLPYSAPYSIADSPAGNYGNNANSSITLTSDISLQNASLAMLSFYARWRIEQGYDYVQVKISTNNGSTWTPLSGKYTKTGNYNQAAGQPLYDGIMNQWVHEEINISEFAGRDIKLRFTLRTDGNTVDDGFLFDDLSVSILDITTGMHSPNTQTLPFISELWPNPSANKIKLTYTLPDFNGKAAVVITDLSGRVVLSMPVDEKKGELEFDASSLSPGLYFCNLVAGTRSLATKKFVKQ